MSHNDRNEDTRITPEPLSGTAVLSICTGILLLVVAGIGVMFDALSRM